MVQPKQISPLDPVLASVEDLTQLTGSYVVGDNLRFFATTDESDGHVTTGVDLYESAVLVGAMVEVAPDVWSYTGRVSAGSKSYTAKRNFAEGSTDSAALALTVLNYLAPNAITTATLIAWFDSAHSIRMGGTLTAQGTTPPVITVTSSSSLDGRTEGLHIRRNTNGALGVGKIDISIDNGLTYPQVGVTTAANIAVTGTDLTIHVAAGNVAADNTWDAIMSGWLDRVSAAATNNYLNTVTGNTRAIIRSAAATASIGAPCARFDGVNDSITCTSGTLATGRYNGADTTFFNMFLIDLRSMPAAGQVATLWAASNITDTDFPYASLTIGGTGEKWVTERRSDAGVSKTGIPNVQTFTGLKLIEDGFDATNRRLSLSTADMVGGDSGVTAPEGGLTITTTQADIGSRQIQSGRANYMNFDLFFQVVFDVRPSEVELWQLRAYVAAQYPNLPAFKSPNDVRILGIDWTAWIKTHMQEFGIQATMTDDADPTAVTTRYGYRQPLQSDGSAYPDNWYMGGASGGDSAEQAMFDDQLKMIAECGPALVRFYDWYPPRDLISVGPVPNQSDIYDASVPRHFASSRKNSVQWAYILQSFWMAWDGNSPGTWLNEAAFMADIADQMTDPSYLKITAGGVANRPVVGIFEAGGSPWNATHIGNLTAAATGAGLGAPYYIQMNANISQVNTLGFPAISAYGPSGTILVGSHNAYAAMVTKCRTIDDPLVTVVNAARSFPLSQKQDPRPTGAGGGWCDEPLYTEFEQALQDVISKARCEVNLNPGGLITLYAITEWGEGGQFFPSPQGVLRGVNVPSRGVTLDAIKNVCGRSKPSVYTDYYHAQSFSADVGGSFPAGWAIVQDLSDGGGTSGAYQYAELQNSTTTNARTWTVRGTRVRVYGGLGAGLGTIRFVFDGGANVDVNQNDGGARRFNQLLFDSGVVSNASHTLAISRVSGLAAYDELPVDKSR